MMRRQTMEATMTKLSFVLAVAAAVLAGSLLIWKAEATPLAGAADSLAVLKGYSSVQQVGCIFGTSRCPAGTKWSCAKTQTPSGVAKKCVCRTC
jgi:hypothetical protein